MKTSNKEKSILKMAEEDPNFKALLNVEWPQPFDFYEELRKLNNPERQSYYNFMVFSNKLEKEKSDFKDAYKKYVY